MEEEFPMRSELLPRPATKWFVVLFGPPAVGKMTVGQALASLTGLKLLHNHMTIELLLPLFSYGTPAFTQLNHEFRRRNIEEVAQSDLPGWGCGIWRVQPVGR